MLRVQSITPLGPVPEILPLDEEVPAVKYTMEKATAGGK